MEMIRLKSVRSKQFPNLLLNPKLQKQMKAMSPNSLTRLLGIFDQINRHGFDPNYVNATMEFIPRYDMVKVKLKDGENNLEWRLFAKKIKKTNVYGIMHLFCKKAGKLKKKDLEYAANFASKEGW